MAQLKIQNVWKRFSKKDEPGLVALADVSLEVRSGEFVSIVGPSGCGKSTLLRIIDGLTPATSGTVELEGVPVTSPSRAMSYVFQSAALLPWRTILQNVLLASRLRGETTRDDEDRGREVLRLVGLEGFEKRYPHELSGGMQQRANLARALFVDSQILLMDEPFGALDAMTRQVMQMELLRICASTNRTVIFVTHALEEAALLSDRVVVMSRRPGRIKSIVDVPFARPRGPETKTDPRFERFCADMWSEIEIEAREAV